MKFAIISILAAATTALATTNACCDSTTTSGAAGIAQLLQSLGLVVQGANVPIGLGCSPITVVGVSGTSCTNDPVTCDQVDSTSLIGINCTPIDVSL
ncbi:hypothetical protein SCHPADRAFT_935309 [Schizopora paradoxa]|uniref:Hydrophobin n=1 Tax=Schizopora paradoxa TaxID=27342 RepID=A0A0H2SR27_9AGAM|nr:hypothetical protein SCHPADRAFT_935309 [Schizopora paradoxa]